MKEIIRGYRDKLSHHLSTQSPFEVRIQTDGAGEYDFSCFGVDANEKLSDDRYMVFYNQTATPNREITLTASPGRAAYTIDLSSLPESIHKLVFTVSIDGDSTLSDLAHCTLTVLQDAVPVLSFVLQGDAFDGERAIIMFEMYRKDEWRLYAIGSGFHAGLSKLLALYGGTEETDSATPPASAPSAPVAAAPTAATPTVTDTLAPDSTASSEKGKLSLEKKISEKAPALISLAKPLSISLKKKNLTEVKAHVALVLDMSSSLWGRYTDGSIQTIVDKVFPLALQFDDNGTLDTWVFARDCLRLPGTTSENYTTVAPRDCEFYRAQIGAFNNEPPAMEDIIRSYEHSKLPAFVLFLSDGNIDESRAIKRLIKSASKLPIFWQFIGISSAAGQTQAKGAFGILEELDTLEGRYVDNANFFSIDDFDAISTDALYDRLLHEFPAWLRAIKEKDMLP